MPLPCSETSCGQDPSKKVLFGPLNLCNILENAVSCYIFRPKNVTKVGQKPPVFGIFRELISQTQIIFKFDWLVIT